MATVLTPKLMAIALALAGTLLLSACSDDATTAAVPTETPGPAPQSEAAVAASDTPDTPEISAAPIAVNTVFPKVVPLDRPLVPPSEVAEELQIIWEVWALLTREYVDPNKLDASDFSEAAIRGMVALLEDPGTYYVRPGAFDITNSDLAGKFEGIGANVSMRANGKLIVVSPIDGGPAEAAGLRPGDSILEVDGQSIEGMSLLEAVAIIRGPRGTRVTLLVLHMGAVDPVEIAITRDVIPLESVLLRSEPGDRIAHIRITSFSADSADTLGKMIRQAVADGAQGLIIDVRDNPGGLLRSAIDVTSQFLKEGLVLYEVDSKGERTNHAVRRGGVATEIPMVVLASEFSASASEILVGALQDHQRAKVVGANSFGKGSVNIFRRLTNNGGLSVTIARFFTPEGRLIDGIGLKPDIEVVSRDRQKADTMQLERAVEELEALIREKQGGSPSS